MTSKKANLVKIKKILGYNMTENEIRSTNKFKQYWNMINQGFWKWRTLTEYPLQK